MTEVVAEWWMHHRRCQSSGGGSRCVVDGCRHRRPSSHGRVDTGGRVVVTCRYCPSGSGRIKAIDASHGTVILPWCHSHSAVIAIMPLPSLSHCGIRHLRCVVIVLCVGHPFSPWYLPYAVYRYCHAGRHVDTVMSCCSVGGTINE